MKNAFALLLLVISLAIPLAAQHYSMHPDVPADSSFAIAREYQKHIKKYPFITVVDNGDTSQITTHANIVYQTINGREFHLDVFHPQTTSSKQKFPVIMIIHGGGWRSGEKDMDHPMACELARRGYAVVCAEYRLSMEALYPAAIIDLKTALRWIRANGTVYPFNTKQVAVQGTSAGGQMAALIASINGKYPKYQGPLYKHYSDKVQAVINIDGVLAFIHPESGEGKDLPGKPSAATLWFGKPVEQDSLDRIEASALTHVNKHTAPCLFINSSIPRFHGGRDDMITAMNQYHISSRVYQHADCMHSFWLFHPWFDETVNQIDVFMKETFQKP